MNFVHWKQKNLIYLIASLARSHSLPNSMGSGAMLQTMTVSIYSRKTIAVPFDFQNSTEKNSGFSIVQEENLQKDFATIRGQISYVCTSTRPDLSYYAATLSQVIKERLTYKNLLLICKSVLQARKPIGIALPRLDCHSIYIGGY